MTQIKIKLNKKITKISKTRYYPTPLSSKDISPLERITCKGLRRHNKE